MAALDFPTATAAGQTFEADTGVIYVYVGTPPNGFWSANSTVTGQAALDARYVQVAGDTMTGNLVNNARILIGTTAEGAANADNLTVADSGDSGITIRSGDSNEGSLFFSDATTGTGEYSGYVKYDHANNNLTFGTSNFDQLQIDSSGNVGIGTMNPTSLGSGFKEVIISGDTEGAGLQLEDINGNVKAGFFTSDISAFAILRTITDHPLTFRTNNIERLRIDSSGRVGIGTSAINSYSAIADNLLIAGSSNAGMSIIDSGDSSQSSLYFYGGTTRRHYIEGGSGASGILTIQSNNAVKFNIGTSEQLRLDSSGRLLVGTATEGQTNADNLTVAENGHCGITIRSSSTTTGNLFFSDATSGTAEYAGAIVYDHSTDSLELYSGGGTERMRIDSSGNVGIGTSSPGTPLHIANQYPSIRLQSNTGSYQQRSTVGQFDNIMYIECDNDNAVASSAMAFTVDASEKMRIDSSGNVGIGLNNSLAGLCVNNTIRSQNTSSNISYIGFAGYTGNTTVGTMYSYMGGDGRNTGYLNFSTNDTERMRINSGGKVGIGTDSPITILDIRGELSVAYAPSYGIRFYNADRSNWSSIGNNIASSSQSANLVFKDRMGEAMRLDGNGRLLVGHTSAGSQSSNNSPLQVTTSSTGAWALQIRARSANDYGFIGGTSTDGNEDIAQIGFQRSTTSTGSLLFYTNNGNANGNERMRIDSAGSLLVGKTNTSNGVEGITLAPTYLAVTRSGGTPFTINRLTNDGTLIAFEAQNTVEGSISVSGGTVSYNGAHLSRWSQLPGGAIRVPIMRGTVLSNIDEMCEWGDEDNEQLNRMKVSDIEGDRNVSGVFQNWDEDDEVYTDDFYCAMTGDFVIRIGKDVTVERGDLLMSAGDGTAKPQEDDIIRSKTIAKVTSTHVSETYNDGSYCVPCVLMAC